VSLYLQTLFDSTQLVPTLKSLFLLKTENLLQKDGSYGTSTAGDQYRHPYKQIKMNEHGTF